MQRRGLVPACWRACTAVGKIIESPLQVSSARRHHSPARWPDTASSATTAAATAELFIVAAAAVVFPRGGWDPLRRGGKAAMGVEILCNDRNCAKCGKTLVKADRLPLEIVTRPVHMAPPCDTDKGSLLTRGHVDRWAALCISMLAVASPFSTLSAMLESAQPQPAML